jgi:hypothetical protein
MVKDNAKFMDDCVSSCQANLNVPQGRADNARRTAHAVPASWEGFIHYVAVNAVTTKELQSPVRTAYEIFDFCHQRLRALSSWSAASVSPKPVDELHLGLPDRLRFRPKLNRSSPVCLRQAVRQPKIGPAELSVPQGRSKA